MTQIGNVINEKQNDQETYIYSASQLKSIGDISPLMEKTHKEEIEDIGYNNYIKLVKFFYGKD